MNQILLNGISLNELLEQFGQLIDAKFEKASPPEKNNNQLNFISRQQVANLLKISLPTLTEWSKLGRLQPYKIGNRVLYKSHEVELALNKVGNLKYKKGGNHAA